MTLDNQFGLGADCHQEQSKKDEHNNGQEDSTHNYSFFELGHLIPELDDTAAFFSGLSVICQSFRILIFWLIVWVLATEMVSC